MFAALMLAATLDATPSPAPTPPYSFDGAFSGYSVSTANAGAETDVSNALLTLTKNTGVLRGTVTIGAYAFPTVGVALGPTNLQPGANTALYGWMPAYDVAYVPNAHVTLAAGQLPSLLGQESGFTFQNVQIQRGLVWLAENTFSRGVRLTYANGRWFGNLGYTDGYYSGNGGRALEGLFGWSPTSNTTWQFGLLVPGSNTPGNVTATVANKREYDFMLSQTYGKLQLLPYVLAVESPSSAPLGYTRSESALGAVLIATYAFSNRYSLAGRVESFANGSATSDRSANADLVGYGPGSRATTWTITPAYHFAPFFLRAEYSHVNVAQGAPGLGFGPSGTFSTQSRVVIETGVQF
ncbi:MAG TPA: outer membrane beta-barrel protein [Candidatus Aquilonibacter sp.]|nr:outer membrane beta-barrel protein [Candidatus Aquilonibacter sp.]